jgi:predicted Zn-dependent peptidase
VLDSHLADALDILCDMAFNAKFDDGDLDNERNVIAEEIGMYEDSPEDLVGEKLLEAIYPGQALGAPILGSHTTLRSFTGAALRAYRDRFFRPPQLTAALAGKYSDGDAALFERLLTAIPAGNAVKRWDAAYTPTFTVCDKPLEQNHLCLALPGLPAGDGRRYVMQLLCGILGGGASSRLNQKLREEHGLCYAVQSQTATFADTGLLCVYTALSRDTEAKALAMICETLTALACDGPTPIELDRHREQVKANVIMGLESTNARMAHAARSMQVLGYVPSPDELIAGYDAVTAAQVQVLAQELLHDPSFSALGQVQDIDEYRKLIRIDH